MDTPYAIVHEGAVPSTQDVAVSAYTASGRSTLVVAERQISGRGRQGRTWIEPDRGMYSSFAYATTWPPTARTLIPLTVAVAVLRVLDEPTAGAVRAKWPNDLLLGGRKAGGVLVEASGDRIVIGCGVNLWWNEPPDFATAIFAEDPGPQAGQSLARRWVDAFVEMESAGWEAWPRAEYERSCVTLGSRVRWDGGSGTAIGIADHGGLIVDTGAERVVVDSGDVHLTERG